ncbi:DNA damage-responsive transcriptional repressor RPH1 [Lecanosticta acicola]|uniref:[histone H3]-trimethyl-L-lysine(9) demethylase n=1 Tax=Lecanosticta acicola TaxID=111012 RepID=A0AAI9E833_9PEZI|nr:DNA damage-responsive transcriptional repressor RPH1 [Lecanosticta acicola]
MEATGDIAVVPAGATATKPPSPEPDVKDTIEQAPVAKPATALTPPTSEEMNHDLKDESDSDLTDLEDEEEIKPDHYWDEENGGRIPVFKPTMDQFRSFKKFMEKVDHYGMKSGIIKVVPPQEWRDSLPALDEHVKRIKIKNPITQEFNGTFGTYTQQNVEKQRSYNLPEWKSLTEQTEHQHPAKRGERRRNQAQVVRGGGNLRGRAAAIKAESEEGTPKPKRKPGRPKRGQAVTEEPASDDESAKTQEPATPKSPPAKKAKGKRGAATSRGAGQAKSVSSRRLNNTSESVDRIDEKAFKNFDYRLEGLDEYTPERCAELETIYWKSLAFNQPMYAADMPGSLFEDKTTSWNVAHLENLLDVLGTKVPGVNTAYLYMGMWKATFAWHLEDVDLYSINYIHFGAPKQWYSISQEDARKFERAMKQIWPVDAKNCDQFLRHKTYLISPDVLQKQYGVKVNKLVHYEGEFVITFPYGYHSGYNIGYNCAESVNFATESWLEFGRIARKCNCEADNVWVDVGEIERKLRGEPTPEYIEETDDEDEPEEEEEGNLPTPPASVKGQKATKKRKREVKKEEPKKKKKIRIKIRVPTREPCVMCPNDNPWEDLLPTDTGKKAHRSCASFTPETYIINVDGQEKVCGVANIDKARLELKCNFCRSKRGACFQCSSKKCTRAFHATCAVAAGVLIDGGLVPTFGEDGTEYYEEGFDFRCRYHRPKMPKVVNVDALEKNSLILDYAKGLKRNDTVQAQHVGGEVYGGLVVENRPSEQTVLVDVLPDGDRVEVEYKWLCVLDPDDSVRPKPTAAALPMPQNKDKRNFSLANRQDGVPKQDEPFHTDPEFKWFDFYNYHTPPPGYQTVLFNAPAKLQVNVDEGNTIFYYLPEVSTEAKVYFTDKPGSRDICAKANFMDRVQPPKTSQQYSAAKQAIAPAHVNTFARIQPQPQTSVGARNEKPYVYKPKEPAKPNVYCAVDHHALNNQRSLIADGYRRPSASFGQPQQPQQPILPHHSPQHGHGAHYGYQSSEHSRASTPLRPFSQDHYYSSRTLPAAFSGEYSRFRRESQGAQTMQRPNIDSAVIVPNYQSVSSQKTALKQSVAPPTPHSSSSWPGLPGCSAGSGLPPNPYALGAGSPPSSVPHNHHSPPIGAPMTPTTSMSSGPKSDGAQTDQGYLHNLRQYPYLLNSYCRSAKEYESPYAVGGGFTPKYQPLELQKSEKGGERKPLHTPNNSMSAYEAAKQNSQQWTPPSQMWDRAGLAHKQQTPPPQQQQPQLYQQFGPRNYPPAIHQTPQDFQRQIQGLPSTASRDGAHARMLRDQGYMPYAHYPPHHIPHRNSFGQAYDGTKMWNSPQAPTPSPLSDPNTPGYGRGHTPTNSGHWAMLPRTESGPHRASGAGYGPMLPQMGGNETWRYN